MNSDSDDVVSLARDEARAVSHQRLQRFLPSADAHTTARAKREYIETQRGISARVVEESLKENNTLSTDDQTSNPGDQQQEQQQDHANRYAFPADWPITGPFANNTDDQE